MMDSNSGMALKAAHAQLERMRGMQYQYHRKFFQWLIGSMVGFFLLGLVGGRIAALWIPFLIVTAGVQASFYLHFCDFSRMHARHLERVINEKCGSCVMMAGRLEDVYFYAMDRPKLSGLLPGAPFHFFSFFTLHWCLLWLAGIIFSMGYGWAALSQGWMQIMYVTGFIVWAGMNGGYLAWYFLKRKDLRVIDTLLKRDLFSTVDVSA